MKIKEYFLAYIKLIYSFIEKYMVLLYLYFRIKLVARNQNIMASMSDNDSGLSYYLNTDNHPANTQLAGLIISDDKKVALEYKVAMTKKYILFKIKHFTNNNGIYEETFMGSLFNKRIYKKELSGKSFSELFRKNYNMYIDEKKALFYSSVYFDLTEEKKCWNKIVNSCIQKVLK